MRDQIFCETLSWIFLSVFDGESYTSVCGLWVKQIALHNVSGPHPIQGVNRLNTWVKQKADLSQARRNFPAKWPWVSSITQAHPASPADCLGTQTTFFLESLVCHLPSAFELTKPPQFHELPPWNKHHSVYIHSLLVLFLWVTLTNTVCNHEI